MQSIYVETSLISLLLFTCPVATLAVLLDCTDGDHPHASHTDCAALEQRPETCEKVR